MLHNFVSEYQAAYTVMHIFLKVTTQKKHRPAVLSILRYFIREKTVSRDTLTSPPPKKKISRDNSSTLHCTFNDLQQEQNISHTTLKKLEGELHRNTTASELPFYTRVLWIRFIPFSFCLAFTFTRILKKCYTMKILINISTKFI